MDGGREKSTFVAAEAVEVVDGNTTEKINAELQVGGKIEGTVTSAVTHKALADVSVAAIGTGVESAYGFGFTEANGHYSIVGLATGSYRVEFGKAGYVDQYYDEQSSQMGANLVEVVQEKTTAGIDAALMPKAPINTAAPVASGTLEVGQTLACTSGSWTGTPKPKFSYSWLRDGVAIAGATYSVYSVQAADVGNGLTCKVTATNESGSVAAVSSTLIVAVPSPPPSPTPIVELASSKLLVSGGSAGTVRSERTEQDATAWGLRGGARLCADAYPQRIERGASRMRSTRAGTPPTTALAGTSLVTTAEVPTIALSPTVTPRRMQAP